MYYVHNMYNYVNICNNESINNLEKMKAQWLVCIIKIRSHKYPSFKSKKLQHSDHDHMQWNLGNLAWWMAFPVKIELVKCNSPTHFILWISNDSNLGSWEQIPFYVIHTYSEMWQKISDHLAFLVCSLFH